MERLTRREEKNGRRTCKAGCRLKSTSEECCYAGCPNFQEVQNRLAAYEDALAVDGGVMSPEEVKTARNAMESALALACDIQSLRQKNVALKSEIEQRNLAGDFKVLITRIAMSQGENGRLKGENRKLKSERDNQDKLMQIASDQIFSTENESHQVKKERDELKKALEILADGCEREHGTRPDINRLIQQAKEELGNDT
jgi:chromosome segregation ATPase